MGYRAHVVTQIREYGSSIFNDYDMFEQYLSKMGDIHSYDGINVSEDETFIEIDKQVIQDEIKRLKELGEENEFEFKPSYGDYTYTNGEIIASWHDALDESPVDDDLVALEWF